jgi:exonuclease III
MSTFDFTIGSLNIRGINKHTKRIAVFNWARSKQFDVMLLQETFSSESDVNLWKSEWGGQAFWAHGTKHSCGVAILIKNGFDLEPVECTRDPNGRYIVLKAVVQGETLYIINLYAPNTEQAKSVYYAHLQTVIDKYGISKNDNMIFGGDWNTILTPGLDKSGGVDRVGETVTTEMKHLLIDYGLVDIWRVKNPITKRFTYRQKRPLVQSRLDYFMITNRICDLVEKPQIMSSFCSDHSCISLKLSPLPKDNRGKGYWKFNASLLHDEEYVAKLGHKLDQWMDEYDYFNDKRVKWEMLKFEIRNFTCDYAAKKKKELMQYEKMLQDKLNFLETQLGNNCSDETKNEYYTCKERISQIEEDRAKGAIIRSREKWLEEGERSTRYFFSLEQYNFSKKHIRKIIIDKETITDEKQILSESATYYENLYKSNVRREYDMYDWISDIGEIPKLDDRDRDFVDNMITKDECYENLRRFENNKSPGNDGLTKEFYVTFWNKISKPLLDSYNYSLENGKLSASQRQAVITLIDKHGKDRSYLSNWRPISLLNLDYKILTKVLAERIKKILPTIISPSQNGYITGRSTADSIRLIQDIIHLSELNHTPAILLTIDFQKAFDSIEWNFISVALEKFNFGPIFLTWIKTLYNDISSCICNNGKTSRYFNLSRGVRQGDPLSPYLFIIGVEILALALKKNINIKGYNVKSNEIKLTQYADDITMILTDFESVNETIKTFDIFGKYSGLRINKDKTEGMLIGPWCNTTGIPKGIKWITGPMKLLGIYLSANPNEHVALNFKNRLDALLRQLHWWKARDLSLRGKVLIIKTLGLSKFQYIASLIHIPQNVVKEVNRIIYEFIWNGKSDKVKRTIFEQDFKRGGYNMITLEDITISASIMWIKKYLDDVDREWKQTMEQLCKVKNLGIFLRSTFDIKELPNSMPDYYLQSITNWSDMATKPLEPASQCLWYNKTLKLGAKTVFHERLMSIGMWVIGDLFDSTGVISFDTWLKRGALERDRIMYYGIVKGIRKAWKNLTRIDNGYRNTIMCGVTVESKFIEIRYMLQKHIKTIIKERKLSSLKQQDHKYKLKHEFFYGSLSQVDWENIFQLPQSLPVDNKTKDLQYKIIMRIVPTNSLLYKMKKVNSPSCVFCMLEQESLEHLFFECLEVKNVWLYVFSEWEKITGNIIVPTLETCILGILDTSVKHYVALNCVLLIVKYYIFKCKYAQCKLSVVHLRNMFRNRVISYNNVRKRDVYIPLLQMF